MLKEAKKKKKTKGAIHRTLIDASVNFEETNVNNLLSFERVFPKRIATNGFHRWVNCLAGFCVLLSVIGTGCQPKAEVKTRGTAAATDEITRVAGIPLKMLDKADLRVNWLISKLAMGQDRRIERIFYHNGQLYLIDNSNKLYALDGAKGILLWTRSLGDSQGQCQPVEFYQDRLLVLLDKTYMELSESDGRILHKVQLKFTPTTSVARTKERIFVGSDNRRFYSLRREDGVILWQSVQPDEPVGRIAVSQGNVYFACKNGALYVSRTDKREKVWQAATNGEVCGVVVSNGQCFLPSTDTALYCFRTKSGTPMWKYLTGGALAELPILTERFAYQGVKLSSLLCMDRRPGTDQGAVKWELPNGYCMLAENGSISYAMTQNKELTLMNNDTGKRVISFYVPDMDLYVRNNEDALIFLADKEGMILSLRPKMP